MITCSSTKIKRTNGLKSLYEINGQPRMQCVAKLSFENEGKIQAFSNIQKPRELSTHRC
jgi:hypothetical protein